MVIRIGYRRNVLKYRDMIFVSHCPTLLQITDTPPPPQKKIVINLYIKSRCVISPGIIFKRILNRNNDDGDDIPVVSESPS